jgi:hypothetical protein
MFDETSVAPTRSSVRAGTPACSRTRKPLTTSPSFSAWAWFANVVSGEIRPEPRPAIAVTILNTEPGT